MAPEAKVCAREGFREQVKSSQVKSSQVKSSLHFDNPERIIASQVKSSKQARKRIWGLRSEICQLVPLHYMYVVCALFDRLAAA